MGPGLAAANPLYHSATGITLASIMLMQIGDLIGRRSNTGSGVDAGLLRNWLLWVGLPWRWLFISHARARRGRILGTGPVPLSYYGLAWLGAVWFLPWIMGASVCGRVSAAAGTQSSRRAAAVVVAVVIAAVAAVAAVVAAVVAVAIAQGTDHASPQGAQDLGRAGAFLGGGYGFSQRGGQALGGNRPIVVEERLLPRQLGERSGSSASPSCTVWMTCRLTQRVTAEERCGAPTRRTCADAEQYVGAVACAPFVHACCCRRPR